VRYDPVVDIVCMMLQDLPQKSEEIKALASLLETFTTITLVEDFDGRQQLPIHRLPVRRCGGKFSHNPLLSAVVAEAHDILCPGETCFPRATSAAECRAIQHSSGKHTAKRLKT
jgi:hypothetical protein